MGLTTAIDRAMTGRAGPVAEDSRLFKDGAKIGSWCVCARIGDGGEGEVYRVKNVETGWLGALKASLAEGPGQHCRFQRELEVLGKIAGQTSADARHFPALLDHGWAIRRDKPHQVPYLVIELLEKFELPSKRSKVRELILDVGEAVRELHRNGYLHRDIKHENLMRRENGEIVLVDFGLVLPIAEASNSYLDRISMMPDGRMGGVGTEGASAPEQSFGHASVESDIYALGALAAKCFHGNPPARWVPVIQKAQNSLAQYRYHTVDEFLAAVKQLIPLTKEERDKFLALVTHTIGEACSQYREPDGSITYENAKRVVACLQKIFLEAIDTVPDEVKDVCNLTLAPVAPSARKGINMIANKSSVASGVGLVGVAVGCVLGLGWACAGAVLLGIATYFVLKDSAVKVDVFEKALAGGVAKAMEGIFEQYADRLV